MPHNKLQQLHVCAPYKKCIHDLNKTDVNLNLKHLQPKFGESRGLKLTIAADQSISFYNKRLIMLKFISGQCQGKSQGICFFMGGN